MIAPAFPPPRSRPRALAEKIARQLFVNGQGEKAQRLVLTVDRPLRRDLGGWGFEPVVDMIEKALKEGGEEVNIPEPRPMLIGEANPYGAEARYALYPLPERSAGGRLCRIILGLEPSDYLRRFERRNLCAREWRLPEARKTAADLANESAGRILVLLGAKVCRAFEAEFRPFTALNLYCDSRFVILPHPSGLSRAWHRPGAIADARRVLAKAGVLP